MSENPQFRKVEAFCRRRHGVLPVTPATQVHSPLPLLLAHLALVGLLLVACFYNLKNYPAIWWDEAIFSETAANLTQTGRQAFTLQSPEQERGSSGLSY